VLASVGARLHDDARDTLVKEGGWLFRREGIPPESHLSPQLVARIQDRSKNGRIRPHVRPTSDRNLDIVDVESFGGEVRRVGRHLIVRQTEKRSVEIGATR
jgi:hypothetical protein